MKFLGLQADDFKISGFDVRDAMMGHSVAYEFDVEVDNKVLPFKLLEDVNRWDYVDLPIFQFDEPGRPGDEKGLVEKKASENGLSPVLAPFQLAGPMELWIQDAKDMRISLPVSIFFFSWYLFCSFVHIFALSACVWPLLVLRWFWYFGSCRLQSCAFVTFGHGFSRTSQI